MPFAEPYNLPFIGSIGESIGLWSDPADDAKLKALRDARAAYQAYRPEAMQARMNALQQVLGAFGPANQMLQQMYGMSVPLTVQNPFPGGLPPAGGPQSPPGMSPSNKYSYGMFEGAEGSPDPVGSATQGFSTGDVLLSAANPAGALYTGAKEAFGALFGD